MTSQISSTMSTECCVKKGYKSCDFCDFNITHGVCHECRHNFAHINGQVWQLFNSTTSTRDEHDPRKNYDESYNWVCLGSPAFSFALRNQSGTLFLVEPEFTQICAPCELVVMKNDIIHGTTRIQLSEGDVINFSTDENNKFGSMIYPKLDSSNQSAKMVSISFTNDNYTFAVFQPYLKNLEDRCNVITAE